MQTIFLPADSATAPTHAPQRFGPALPLAPLLAGKPSLQRAALPSQLPRWGP